MASINCDPIFGSPKSPAAACLSEPMQPSRRSRWLTSSEPSLPGGNHKDGPVSVAKFELGESDEPEQREARALRRRQASDVIDQLLAGSDGSA